MSENPNCPYCGSSVSTDHVRAGYDEKVKVRCHNCGGQFEYMPGFGSFSLPGEGPQAQPRVTSEGSYPGTIYQGDAPWTTESPPRKKSSCGTCCGICACCCCGIPIFTIVLMVLGIFANIF